MTRFVLDCDAVLHLARERIEVSAEHELPGAEGLTKLQADAFVTLNADLARQVEGIVPTATIDALRTA